MGDIQKKNLPLINYLLIGFGVIITLNMVLIRYPADFVLPFLKAVFLVSGIFVYGFGINFLFREKEAGFPETFAAGLIFTTFYFFLVSSLGILNPVTILFFCLAPLPALIFFLIKKRDILKRSLSDFFRRSPAEYAIFIFPLIYASLPSSFYDTMVYHLGIPNLFLQHGGFIETSQMVYANTSIYYEVSLIPAVFSGLMVPRLFHFLIGMIFCLAIADTAVLYFKLKKRLLFLVVLVSIPVTFFLLTTVKNDLISAFFILMGIRSYLKEEYKSSAIFWGFSVGVKYFNVLPLAIFLVLFLFNKKFRNIKEYLKVVSIYSIFTFILLLPLLMKNFFFMNNPFFPFLTGLFKSNGFDLFRYELLRSDIGTLIHSIKDIFTLPYTLSFQELGSGGLAGVQFLVFIPFAILIKKIKNPVLLYFSFILLFAGAFLTASIRFEFIALAILSIYVVLIYEEMSLIKVGIMKPLLYIIIALNIVTAFGYNERIYRAADLYSGKSDREAYKTDLLPGYSSITYINQNTPEDSGVLIVGDTRNFYLQRKYYVSSALDYSVLKEYLAGETDIVDFLKKLKEDGIDYILYNKSEFQRLNIQYKRLSDESLRKFSEFLPYLSPVYQKNQSIVLKIPEHI